MSGGSGPAHSGIHGCIGDHDVRSGVEMQQRCFIHFPIRAEKTTAPAVPPLKRACSLSAASGRTGHVAPDEFMLHLQQGGIGGPSRCSDFSLKNCANSLYIWGVNRVFCANKTNDLAPEKTGCESCRPSQPNRPACRPAAGLHPRSGAARARLFRNKCRQSNGNVKQAPVTERLARERVDYSRPGGRGSLRPR